MADHRLQIYTSSSSPKAFNTVSTLVVGSKAAVLFDPPFFLVEAEKVVKWIKEKTDKPLKAIFTTHIHPDHYFSARVILEANPGAAFHAAPYVCSGIEATYEHKLKFWPPILGKEHFDERPKKPTPFNNSFFTLEGDLGSPIVLLGPLQGDIHDSTLFWLPKEKAVVCGDVVYGRSAQARADEVPTIAGINAWIKTLDLIKSLEPTTVIPGHLAEGIDLDSHTDLEHTRKTLLNAIEERRKTQGDNVPKADGPDSKAQLESFII